MRLRRPTTSTAVASVPATTCALVITSSGAKTKPDPSSCRWHDGALPRILRTLGCAAATAGLRVSAALGGPVAVTGVRAKGLSTSGKPELSSSWRSSAGSCLAAVGMTESTALSTCDPRTPAAMPGRLAVASGSATSQAATTTASACRIEPSVESTARKRSPVMRSRTRRPRNTPRGLAQHDQHHHDRDAHDHPGVRVADALGQQRGHPHPDDRAAEHADERQQRHRHAVSPPGDGREQREGDDDEIDPAHGPAIS